MRLYLPTRDAFDDRGSYASRSTISKTANDSVGISFPDSAGSFNSRPSATRTGQTDRWSVLGKEKTTQSSSTELGLHVNGGLAETLGDGEGQVSQPTPSGAGMRIAVFGATGRTGRHLLIQAQEKGLQVNALARHPEKLGEFRSRVASIEGNVTDPVAVLQTVARCGAVLSVLGPNRDSPADLLTTASLNILTAMRKEGTKRVIVLTNTAVKDPSDRLPLAQNAVRFILPVVNGRLVRDSIAAAQIIADSGLDWTLVRPAILTDGPRTGKYTVGPLARGVPLKVSRADVAEFMVSCVVGGRFVRERPAIGGGSQ